MVVVGRFVQCPSPNPQPHSGCGISNPVSPLPVLRRGDSPTPPSTLSRPQRCHCAPERAFHLLSVPTPEAPVTMTMAELIAALILLKFSLWCQPPHPHPGKVGGRPRGVGWGGKAPLCCTAVVLTPSALNPWISPSKEKKLSFPHKVKFWSLVEGVGD